MSELLEKPVEETLTDPVLEEPTISIEDITETDIVVFNDKIYSLRASFTLLYLTDYFIDKTEENRYSYEYTINTLTKTIKHDKVSNSTKEFQESLYEKFKTAAVILPRDAPQELIYKKHIELLEKRVTDYTMALRLSEAIKAREDLYKSNLLQSLNQAIQSVSSILYENASKGKLSISIAFDISIYNMTKEFSLKTLPDLELPNSDGKYRTELCRFVLFLLRDQIEKDIKIDEEEEFANETLQLWLLHRLQNKFPHLRIEIVTQGKVFPTVRFHLLKSYEKCML